MRKLKNRGIVFTVLVATFAVLLTWRKISAGDSISQNEPPYEAPLMEDDSGLQVIPKFYQILLFPGHSISDLSTAIGQDIQPHISHVFDELHVEPGDVIFTVKDVDDKLLASIRAYKSVKIVYLDYTPELDDVLTKFDEHQPD
ncbi:hypothetical protein JX265_007154 [Neoarthrinium moseri]|uniref:Uncharacterized protein n=1 Tax=Neoarthrinium moseri TaxID=1658444 RepID=A0A9Q0AQ68_9PEZI|nr:uncharacterized protein JN550_010054 [Neoarthrinium moseri]KAI1862717.1 hypothetical protein JN550_010054 [Neoarthrinium moseri]KAI1868331.1 hypothetical protein JX265_007154 [Neoarthrinium moseri]